MNIEFDRKKLIKLKRAYTKAVNAGQDMFVFEGREWVTAYAKYAIEYLDTKFK
jgi:hypothetical protein